MIKISANNFKHLHFKTVWQNLQELLNPELLDAEHLLTKAEKYQKQFPDLNMPNTNNITVLRNWLMTSEEEYKALRPNWYEESNMNKPAPEAPANSSYESNNVPNDNVSTTTAGEVEEDDGVTDILDEREEFSEELNLHMNQQFLLELMMWSRDEQPDDENIVGMIERIEAVYVQGDGGMLSEENLSEIFEYSTENLE